MAVLIVGARGRIAGRVIDELVAADVPVRAVTSDPTAVQLPDSVPVSRGSGRAPESLAEVMRGVDSVFLYADPKGVDGVISTARNAGVTRLVLLSSLAVTLAEASADDPSADLITWRHVVAEEAIAASDIPSTFVRPGMFATNTLRWVPGIREHGTVRAARPGAEATPIHERDIAAVTVRALTEPGHEGARYSITGPESLNQRRQVELISEAIGRPVRFVEISDDEARADIARWSTPQIAERLVNNLIASDGIPAAVYDGVAKVLGRPARAFAEWATDHATDFS